MTSAGAQNSERRSCEKKRKSNFLLLTSHKKKILSDGSGVGEETPRPLLSYCELVVLNLLEDRDHCRGRSGEKTTI